MERVEPILPIETERLILRSLRADDLEALHAYESREDVARWLYWGPRSADEVRERLERKLAFRSIAVEGDVLSLGITRKGSDALIGDLVLALISEEHRAGEIGFIVHPDHQGHGYATEAGEAVLRIAFEDAGLHRVIGRTEARNVGSARTLEKLGMRLEAHLVENEWVKGEWQSELVYAILDREWRERHGAPTTREEVEPRVALIADADGLDAEARAVLERVVETRGSLLRPFQVLLHAPPLAARVAELGEVVRFGSELEDADRELATLATGRARRCPFVWTSHLDAARAAGVDPDAIALLERDGRGTGPRGAAIVAYVNELCATGRVTGPTFDAAEGWLGERGVVELALTVGYYTMLGDTMGAVGAC